MLFPYLYLRPPAVWWYSFTRINPHSQRCVLLEVSRWRHRCIRTNFYSNASCTLHVHMLRITDLKTSEEYSTGTIALTLQHHLPINVSWKHHLHPYDPTETSTHPSREHSTERASALSHPTLSEHHLLHPWPCGNFHSHIHPQPRTFDWRASTLSYFPLPRTHRYTITMLHAHPLTSRTTVYNTQSH